MGFNVIPFFLTYNPKNRGTSKVKVWFGSKPLRSAGSKTSSLEGPMILREGKPICRWKGWMPLHQLLHQAQGVLVPCDCVAFLRAVHVISDLRLPCKHDFHRSNYTKGVTRRGAELGG